MGTTRKKISNKLQMIQGQANPNVWCTKMVVWHHQLSLTLNCMQSKQWKEKLKVRHRKNIT
jgi:hypothetical protein